MAKWLQLEGLILYPDTRSAFGGTPETLFKVRLTMNKEIADILKGADTRGWKQIKVDFGDDFLDIKVPDDCEILTMPSMPCLVDSAASIAS